MIPIRGRGSCVEEEEELSGRWAAAVETSMEQDLCLVPALFLLCLSSFIRGRSLLPVVGQGILDDILRRRFEGCSLPRIRLE